MKLNELKESVVNEIDARSLFGDYGAAAAKTGLGSLMGKNVLSTTDQMAKDDFITKFTSRAASGLESAINSGLVDVGATGQSAQPTAQTTAQQTPQGAQATTADTIAQTRQQKQAQAAQVAQQQMKRNPAPVAGRNVSPTPAQNRQQKLATAAQSAQQQMAPVSKLPANQFAKSASNVRQQQQGQAATAAQGKMTPKPVGPTPKTPEQIRQAKQAAATQAAQGQMASNTQPAQNTTPPAQQQSAAPTKAPSTLDKPWDPATGKGAKYDGVTGEATPEWQKELDRQEAARLEKVEANRIASQADAAERDARNAELVRQGMRQNPSNVTNNITQTNTAPNTSITTTDPAEIQAKMQAKIDAMKEKNPKLAAAMQAEIDDQFKQDKLDNTIKMPKRNKKPKGKVAESRFDKLNYLFESIIAEQDIAKQSISQYIMNFFKQFMKGVDIKDPTVMTNVTALAKELEQNYAKDRGKTTLPKLANLAYSVSHAQQMKEPETQPAAQTAATTGTSAPAVATQPAQATQQAKMTAAQIKKLMQGMTTKQKQSILASLQAELGKTTQPTISMGGKKQDPNDPATAKLMAMAKQQGKI